MSSEKDLSSLSEKSSKKDYITIIMPKDPSSYWETDWLLELFPVPHFHITTRTQIKRNTIWIVGNPSEYLKVFEEYEKRGIDFGLIHLSDEFYTHKYNVYDNKNCKLIIRNYHNRNLNNRYSDKIIDIALGYKYKFWNNSDKTLALSQTVEQRKEIWSFAGSVKSSESSIKENRKVMLEKLNSLNVKNTTHLTTSFGSSDALSTDAYRNLLLNTLFCPNPIGHKNLDCFRLYEALEAGCIPITLKSSDFQPYNYFESLLGNSLENSLEKDLPFYIVDTWEEARNLIESLLKDPVNLENKRLEIYTWWCNYKKNLTELIRERIFKVL
jgi:hypothetical protein